MVIALCIPITHRAKTVRTTLKQLAPSAELKDRFVYTENSLPTDSIIYIEPPEHDTKLAEEKIAIFYHSQ